MRDRTATIMTLALVVSLTATADGSKRFGKFLDGFKPEENMATKTIAQAMEAAGLVPDKVNRSWKTSVR
jgi:hypothetical protein